jgi:hypothetical protein
MTLGWAAANRGDYEVPLLFYEPDVEIRGSAEFARSLWLAESYHGHQGFVEVWRDIRQDMAEARFEPEGVIDLGDRYAVRLTGAAVGRASGVAIWETQGNIFYFSPRGLFARQEAYMTWEETLAALERRD